MKRSLNEIKQILEKVMSEYFDSADVKSDNIDPTQMVKPNMSSQSNLNLISPSVKNERSAFSDILIQTIEHKCPVLKEFKKTAQYIKQFNESSIIYDFNKKLDDLEINIEIYIRYYHKDVKMFHTNDYKITLNFEIFNITPDVDSEYGSAENVSKDSEDEELVNDLNVLKKGNSVANLLVDIQKEVYPRLKKFSNIIAGKYNTDIFNKK